MILRHYQPSDAIFLFNMLWLEGVKQEDMAYCDNETTVLVDKGIPVGFYTIEYFDRVKIHLIHLCVSKETRNHVYAFKLWASFKQELNTLKPPFFVFNISETDKKLFTFFNLVCTNLGCYFRDLTHSYYLAAVRRQ